MRRSVRCSDRRGFGHRARRPHLSHSGDSVSSAIHHRSGFDPLRRPNISPPITTAFVILFSLLLAWAGNPVTAKADAPLPNDPRELPWTSDNDFNWALRHVKADVAWNTVTGQSNVIIGIIDMPIFADHEDLADNMRASKRYAGDSYDFSRVNNHGTFIAGIACAKGDNGKGTTGVAQSCDMRDFGERVRNIWGRSSAQSLDLLSAAMDDAGRAGARVVNMSLAMTPRGEGRNDRCDRTTEDPFTRQQIEEKLSATVKRWPNTLWVVGAGNSCKDAGNTFPGALSNSADPEVASHVINVAAVTRDGGWARYSNWGDSITVAAPGGQRTIPGARINQGVHSTYTERCIRTGLFGRFGPLQCSSDYGYYDFGGAGTSYAAPFVTGTAALMYSANSAATPKQVKECIVAGDATDVVHRPGEPAPKVYRVLNVDKTIKCIRPGQEVLPFDGLSSPAALTVDASGRVIVADTGNNRVVALSSGAATQQILPLDDLHRPVAVAVDAARDLFVLSGDGSYGSYILKYSPESSTPTVLPIEFASYVADSNGLAATPTGDVYATSVMRPGVWRLNADATTPVLLGSDQEQRPTAVAVDGAGQMFLAADNEILKVPAGTDPMNAIKLPFNDLGTAAAIAVNNTGDIFVVDNPNPFGQNHGGDRVLILRAGSSTPTELPFDGLVHPTGIALNSAGDVFVTDAGNNRVLKLTSALR